MTGGLAAIRLARQRSERWLVVAGMRAVAAGTAVILVPGVPAALTGAAVIGLGAPVAVVGLYTAMQRYTPGALQGRWPAQRTP